jgi:hypothetical protein
MAFGLYAMISPRRGVTLDIPRLFMSLSILLTLPQPLFSLFGSLVNAPASISCLNALSSTCYRHLSRSRSLVDISFNAVFVINWLDIIFAFGLVVVIQDGVCVEFDNPVALLEV